MNRSKQGFSLIELLAVLTILATVAGYVILKEVDSRNRKNMTLFINDAYNIIKAVDHRIAIDGYDPDLWMKNKWDDEEEIVEDLIKKDLTSKNLSTCTGGKWEPSIESEKKTKLIECNLWNNRKSHGESISAKLDVDQNGFIQSFDIFVKFNESFLSENVVNIKYALREIKIIKQQQITGIHTLGLYSMKNDKNITAWQCVQDMDNCSLKLSLTRSGGNEYLRVDGENSMISSHISFIESKGHSPMKCIRWSKSSSGTWKQKVDSDCGIGIYNSSPISVDLAINTGTFKNIVLDKTCTVYEWTGAAIVDSGKISPCGIVNGDSEIIQVIDNVIASRATIKDLKSQDFETDNIVARNANISELNSSIAYIDHLVAKMVESENGDFNNFDAITASIDDLKSISIDSNSANIDYLESVTGEIKNLTSNLIVTDRIIVDEISAQIADIERISTNIINTDSAIIDRLTANVADIDQIVTPLLNAEVVNISNELNVNGNSNFNGDVKFNGEVLFRNAYVNDNLNVAGDLNANALNSTGIRSSGNITALGGVTSTTTVTAPVGDFSNINQTINNLIQNITNLEIKINNLPKPDPKPPTNNLIWVANGQSSTPVSGGGKVKLGDKCTKKGSMGWYKKVSSGSSGGSGYIFYIARCL